MADLLEEIDVSNPTCLVPDCDRACETKTGICGYHYRKDFNEGAEVTYNAAHHMVFKARGLARLHPCVDCGTNDGNNRQWSYDHLDSDELVSRGGARYSLDPQHYAVRCVGCHAQFDSKHRKPHGWQGISRLKDLATELEPEIRNAIAERKAARDPDSKEFWDTELDRLSALLITA